MRKITSILLIVAMLAPVSAARTQQQQQAPPINPRQAPPPPTQAPQERGVPVIRSFSDLVLIDVQVTDKSGKPVKGLKPENFKLFEDNKEQKIASHDYYDIETIETAGAQDQTPVMVSLGAVTSPEKVREMVRDRRMIVLFFDMTSLELDEIPRAVNAAQKYVREQMTPADIVAAVVFGNRLSVLSDFTNNREFLLRSIGRLQPGKDTQLAGQAEAAATEGQETVTEDTGAAFTADDTEFNIFNTDRKLAAIEGLCDLLRQIPGKKSVIQFTGGITQTGQENRSQLRAATDAANRANVSLYTVDMEGLKATMPGGDATTASAGGTSMYSGASVFRQTSSRNDSRETLATLASDTGGKSFFDTGDFKEVFDTVQADTSGYYLLGYYSTNPQKDGRWRSVRVRVDVPGVKARWREGYYAPKDYGRYTAEDRERQLEEAMSAENPRVELPLVVDTSQFRLSDNEIFVPIAAKLASSALEWAEKRGRKEAEFDFAAEARVELAEGRFGPAVGALRDTMKVKLDTQQFQSAVGAQQRALVYQGGLILGPGRYRLKFLARENETGRIGTFEQEVNIPSRQGAKLQLSSVLLSSQVEPVRNQIDVQKKAFAQDVKMKKSPLEVGGERVIPSVTRVFTTQQRLYILFQAYLPAKMDPTQLRAGLVFFRNGQRVSDTPVIEPSEVDEKARTVSFRMSLPLEKLPQGRYMVQAIVVEAGGEQAAFARGYFALRAPTVAKPATTGGL
jgi:VWFA-related protein